MPLFTDNVLYKTRQHILILVSKCLRLIIPIIITVVFLGWILFPEWSIVSQCLWIVVLSLIVVIYEYFLWSKSYLLITNEKLVKKVRNGIFSKFHMAIHYDNIRDVAFSKNNVFHYLTDTGSLFARSSAAAVGDFEAYWTPRIEKVYKLVNYLHNLDPKIRKNLDHIDGVTGSMTAGRDIVWGQPQETLDEAAQKEIQTLLSIQWIKEVVVLSDSDRRHIFEHEEDRNHGVYESLRKQVLLAATHDSTFREPDEAIVMKAEKKVIFPTVKFYEIQRSSVVSSSPGQEVHEYLVPKFQNLWEYDATLIIWFDI